MIIISVLQGDWMFRQRWTRKEHSEIFICSSDEAGFGGRRGIGVELTIVKTDVKYYRKIVTIPATPSQRLVDVELSWLSKTAAEHLSGSLNQICCKYVQRWTEAQLKQCE